MASVASEAAEDEPAAAAAAAWSCTDCMQPDQVHHVYVYLLSDKRCVNNPSEHKLVPYVDWSVNPYVSLRAHNREGKQFGVGNQLTKPGAGHYQLELVFGPLSQLTAEHFTRECRNGSRKILNRILCFCELAGEVQQQAPDEPNGALLYAADPARVQRLFDQRQLSTLPASVRKRIVSKVV